MRVGVAARDGDVLIIQGRLDGGAGNRGQSITAQSDPVYVANHIYPSYFQGYPDGTFGPERPLTRAEAAAVTARFLGLKAAPRSIFPDVPVDHRAAGYITAVYDASIMKGDDLGNFNPESPITRSEMTATVLRVMVDEENIIRYSQFDPAPGAYQDVAASHWFYDYLRLGSQLNITHPAAGHPAAGSLYLPDEAIGRADAAVLIAMSLRRGELIDGDTPVRQVFADVDRNHWGFGWVAQVARPDHRGVNIDQRTMLLIEYLSD